MYGKRWNGDLQLRERLLFDSNFSMTEWMLVMVMISTNNYVVEESYFNEDDRNKIDKDHINNDINNNINNNNNNSNDNNNNNNDNNNISNSSNLNNNNNNNNSNNNNNNNN